MEKYTAKFKRQMDSFRDDTFKVNDGYEFNVPKILRKIDLYYSSRFLTGNYDKDGFKKHFYNIIKHRTLGASKAVDIDTKNITVTAPKGEGYYVSWFFETELREYLKENGYAELFNVWAEKYPRYGHIVAKNVDGVPKDVSLKNLVWDATLPIEKSPYVHEKILYDYDEFKELAKDKDWENSDEVITLYGEMGKETIQVIESYGYVDGDDIEGDEYKSDELYKVRVITAGMEFYKPEDDKKNAIKPIVLEKPIEVDEFPYMDLAWDTEDGRGMGIGIPEDLFTNQESVNEIQNMKRKALYWNSKVVFQTRDNTAPSNLQSKIKDGQVLQNLSNEITRIDMGDRNLGFYTNELQIYEKNADEKAFSFEVNTGEALPSGTPFRLGAILSNAVNSHFAFKREKFGLFIKRIINEFVIPEFKKAKRKKHSFGFSGDGERMELVKNLVAEALTIQTIKDGEKQGVYVNRDKALAVKQQILDELSKKDKLFMELPDNIYDDIERKVNIEITGESVDTQSSVTTLTTVYQVLAQRGDPRADRILEMILNEVGQNPKGILGVQAPAQQIAPDVAGMGGGQQVQGIMNSLTGMGAGQPATPLAQ